MIRQTRCPSQSSQIGSLSQLEASQANRTGNLAAPVAISGICRVLIVSCCQNQVGFTQNQTHDRNLTLAWLLAGLGSRLVSSPLASGTSWKSMVSGLAALAAPPLPPQRLAVKRSCHRNFIQCECLSPSFYYKNHCVPTSVLTERE